MQPLVTIFRIVGRLATATALAVGVAGFASAEDFFLIIGGGYDPSSNPASLERDMVVASGVIQAAAPGSGQQEVYFADGADPQRDVQYVDAESKRECPPAVRIMAELFGDPQTVGFRYRDNGLPDVAGPTDFALLDRRFRELSRELESGDRLIIYAAGHGAEASDPAQDAAVAGAVDDTGEASVDAAEPLNPYDTSLSLWNNDELRASELCGWLDRLPRDVTVVLVMVQCYSGGFAHAIFERNDQELGLSPARRCGFFSQLHDRAAAGCAAELGAEAVEEYSQFFWAALGGETRTGEAVDADYDDSGATSLAEAHAYAVIDSNTIDVPVRTSEALLRRYSRLGGPYGAAGAAEEDAQKSDQSGGARAPGEPTDLLEPSGPLAAIAALARPDQRAIIERLGVALAAGRRLTVEDVRVELAAAEEAWADAQDALDAAMTVTDEAQIAAQDDVYRQWPELYFTYSPTAAELMGEQSEEFVAAVERLGSYGALLAARGREDELAAASDAAECALAKVERLLRTIDDVVLAANLPKVAPPDIVARYEHLIKMEEGTLTEEP